MMQLPEFAYAFNHDGFGVLGELARTHMTEGDAARVLVEPFVDSGCEKHS